MEPVERWLLVLYLPLLAPLVVLTFFTWPWKVIGHAFRGIAMSLRATWRGYSRSRHSHRRRPFSLWRNMFLGYWTELARQHHKQTGTSLAATGSDLPQAYMDTLLECTKETQTRISASLRASLVAHCIIAVFLFLVTVRPMHNPGTGNGRNSVAVDLSALFAGLAFVLCLAIAGVYAHLQSLMTFAGTPEQFYWFICSWERASAGGHLATATIITLTFASMLAAVFELFADWVFIVLLFSAGTLLYGYLYFWADSMWCPYNGAYVHFSQAFHRELLGKETLQAHPSCCAFWELEPVLTGDAKGSLYDRWGPRTFPGGVRLDFPAVVALGTGLRCNVVACSALFNTLLLLLLLLLCDRMDRYLWRESQVSWYVGSSGGALLTDPSMELAYGKAGGRSSPLPTTVSSGAAAAAGAGAGAAGRGSGKVATESSLYSGWPSLMRYNNGTSTKLKGRRSGSGGPAGLQQAQGPTDAPPGASSQQPHHGNLRPA